MYALGNLPKPVLRPDLRKLDDLHGKIFWDFLFVKLTGDYLAQLSLDNARMRVLFAQNFDAEYVRILNVYSSTRYRNGRARPRCHVTI